MRLVYSGHLLTPLHQSSTVLIGIPNLRDRAFCVIPAILQTVLMLLAAQVRLMKLLTES